MEEIAIKYYIFPKVFIDDNSNLLKKYRIFRIPNNFPIYPSNIPGYSSLKELRKKDRIWKLYHKADPKSANKICKERFIYTPSNFILTPSDDEFNRVSFKLLKHTVFGELKSDITGIHLFTPLNKSIIEVAQIGEEDTNGIWKANIKYYSHVRDKIYKKEKSTMFPKSWDPSTYMFKIFYAYKNRKQCQEDPTKFHSTTDCGIPVDFIIKNGELKTAYPIYSML